MKLECMTKPYDISNMFFFYVTATEIGHTNMDHNELFCVYIMFCNENTRNRRYSYGNLFMNAWN